MATDVTDLDAEGSQGGVMMNEQAPTTARATYPHPKGLRVIELSWVEDHTEVIVTTRASVYRIRILNGRRGRVMIQGGKFFPTEVPAFVLGEIPTCGIPKLGRIQVGFALEIVSRDLAVRTGRVQSIEVCPPPAASMSRLPNRERELAGAA